MYKIAIVDDVLLYHYSTITSIECMIPHLKPIIFCISSRAFMQMQGQWKELLPCRHGGSRRGRNVKSNVTWTPHESYNRGVRSLNIAPIREFVCRNPGKRIESDWNVTWWIADLFLKSTSFSALDIIRIKSHFYYARVEAFFLFSYCCPLGGGQMMILYHIDGFLEF